MKPLLLDSPVGLQGVEVNTSLALTLGLTAAARLIANGEDLSRACQLTSESPVRLEVCRRNQII